MKGNEGFLALGTLVVALMVLAARGWDGDGRWNPTREAAPARFERGLSGERSITLSAGPGGHFFFEAEAFGPGAGRGEGAPVRFMVDSGASVVTLTESDARRAGITLEDRDYNRAFDTANGTIRAASAKLDRLVIGDAVLDDLFVSVVRDEQLSGSLFGVNGLNRFDRRETTADRLVLTMD